MRGAHYYLQHMQVLAPCSYFPGTIMGGGTGAPDFSSARLRIGLPTWPFLMYPVARPQFFLSRLAEVEWLFGYCQQVFCFASVPISSWSFGQRKWIFLFLFLDVPIGISGF